MTAIAFVRWALSVLLVSALVACGDPVPAACNADAGAVAPSAAEVCAHLRSINCPVADCESGYAEWQRSMDMASFNRTTACYRNARTCAEVDTCNRACSTR
jgi:hypothetical protein